MSFDNSTNHKRVEKIGEIISLIEKSAASNKATAEDVTEMLAPVFKTLEKYSAPSKPRKQGSAPTWFTIKQMAEEASLKDLTQAMAVYIRWLSEHWEELETEIPEYAAQEARLGRALFPAGQSRLADYYALFAITGRLLMRMYQEMGAIDAAQAHVLQEENRQVMIDLLRNQGQRVAAASPASKFWQAISDLLAQRRAYFAPRRTVAYPPPDHATLIGWYDEDRAYLLTNSALTEAKRYWEGLDERLDILTDAFRRILQQQGYVDQRADRQMERQTYINKDVGRARTLWLDIDAMRNQAGIVLGGEDEDLDQ